MDGRMAAAPANAPPEEAAAPEKAAVANSAVARAEADLVLHSRPGRPAQTAPKGCASVAPSPSSTQDQPGPAAV